MENRKESFSGKILLWLAENVLPLLIRILGMTWRIKFYGIENFLPQRVIFAIWHGHIIPHSYAFRNRGVKVLVSRSRDGEFISRAIRKLGFGTIRGSSSRDGAKALLQIVRELNNGARIAITPDGPRGPGYVVKEGTALAGIKSGAPIVPVIAVAKHAIYLKSWDKFTIPLPFSRIDIFIKKPLYFKENADIEEAVKKIQGEMQIDAEKS